MSQSAKEHWDQIYRQKQPNEVSWTQEVPEASLAFIHDHRIPTDARIIDIGGGDSKLVDHLLKEGYSNVTVLDISGAAIARAKLRLGAAAAKVKWIETDILDFNPDEKYDLWHDRAAFHFQTHPDNIRKYLDIVKKSVDGMVILGTFSTDGPTRCSGLDIRQYDEFSMKHLFVQNQFRNTECKREDHITPSGSVQNFIFCGFIREDQKNRTIPNDI